MSNCLLKNRINEIQYQYLALLKTMSRSMENEKFVMLALDSVALFWRKNNSVIDMYLEYIVKEKNTVFYTYSAHFSVDGGEQYPLLLMGDLHIFDDQLGVYYEFCCRNRVSKTFSESAFICAKNNISILEKCGGLIKIFPIQSAIMYEGKKGDY